MLKFRHIWSILKFLCFNESQRYSVAWEELSGLKYGIILDKVVEEKKAFEMLKNCTVQPFSPGPVKGILQPDMNICMEMLENPNVNPERHLSHW